MADGMAGRLPIISYQTDFCCAILQKQSIWYVSCGPFLRIDALFCASESLKLRYFRRVVSNLGHKGLEIGRHGAISFIESNFCGWRILG